MSTLWKELTQLDNDLRSEKAKKLMDHFEKMTDAKLADALLVSMELEDHGQLRRVAALVAAKRLRTQESH